MVEIAQSAGIVAARRFITVAWWRIAAMQVFVSSKLRIAMVNPILERGATFPGGASERRIVDANAIKNPGATVKT
jgi:hypothetical protein